MNDFNEVDAQGQRLSDRFPGLSSWKTVEHENLSHLPRTVCDLVKEVTKIKPPKQPHREMANETSLSKKPSKSKIRTKINFKLVPEEVRCEVNEVANVYNMKKNQLSAMINELFV